MVKNSENKLDLALQITQPEIWGGTIFKFINMIQAALKYITKYRVLTDNARCWRTLDTLEVPLLM